MTLARPSGQQPGTSYTSYTGTTIRPAAWDQLYQWHWHDHQAGSLGLAIPVTLAQPSGQQPETSYTSDTGTTIRPAAWDQLYQWHWHDHQASNLGPAIPVTLARPSGRQPGTSCTNDTRMAIRPAAWDQLYQWHWHDHQASNLGPAIPVTLARPSGRQPGTSCTNDTRMAIRPAAWDQHADMTTDCLVTHYSRSVIPGYRPYSATFTSHYLTYTPFIQSTLASPLTEAYMPVSGSVIVHHDCASLLSVSWVGAASSVDPQSHTATHRTQWPGKLYSRMCNNKGCHLTSTGNPTMWIRRL